MLVFSRRKNERINFPTLGISITVCRHNNRTVKLGIEAPADVRVLRGELVDFEQSSTAPDVTPQQAESIRDQLQLVATAIRLSQNQMHQGKPEIAEQSLEDAIAVLSQLESQFDCVPDESDAFAVQEAKTAYRSAATVDSLNVADVVAKWYGQWVSEFGVARKSRAENQNAFLKTSS